MILGIGLMVSVYLIFLSLPGALNAGVSKLKNHFISRVTTLVLGGYLLFIIDSLYNWQGDVVFLDGMCKINTSILSSEIYLLVLILAIVHLQAIYSRRPELYLIILSNIIGLVYLISSNDWVITVIAWELFNLSLYLLVSINSSSEAALSAAIKYFLLSALTTTFLLLSVALLYALTGSTHYDNLSLSLTMLSDFNSIQWPLLLMVVTFLFKIGAAPFHNWSPDLYDGVPTTITSWMIHIPKLAVLTFLMQIYHLLQPLELIFMLVGVASLIVGSVGLGSQWRIKRFLSYSSISHLGFLLLALSSLQFDSFYYYIIIYGLTSVTLFAILLAVGQAHWSGSHQREVLLISQLAGLFKLNQPLALAWSLSLFSLAGIPPLSGFFAKLSVLQAYLNLGYYWIALIAILTSVLSAANYLYLVKITHFDLPNYDTALAIPRSVSLLIALLSSFGLFFIVLPASFLILTAQLLFLMDFGSLGLGLALLPLISTRRMVDIFYKEKPVVLCFSFILLLISSLYNVIYCAGESESPLVTFDATVKTIAVGFTFGTLIGVYLKRPQLGAAVGLTAGFGGGFWRQAIAIRNQHVNRNTNNSLSITNMDNNMSPKPDVKWKGLEIDLGWKEWFYNIYPNSIEYQLLFLGMCLLILALFFMLLIGINLLVGNLYEKYRSRISNRYLVKLLDFIHNISNYTLIIYFFCVIFALVSNIYGIYIILYY